LNLGWSAKEGLSEQIEKEGEQNVLEVGGKGGISEYRLSVEGGRRG